MSFQLTSRAFGAGSLIPSVYTCEGKDISPPLEWKEVPPGTKSLALICEDPDSHPLWSHWVIYNIPPGSSDLQEAFPNEAKRADGTLQGVNDFGRVGYGGPCPPSGVHHYYFKLFALDAPLSLPSQSAKTQVEQAMKGHILAQTELLGLYQRSAR